MLDRLKVAPWRKRLLASTRGKILTLLRSDNRTVADLAGALHLTDNAVRAHLATLVRDGLAREIGVRPGLRKPHVVYALTPANEHLFPKSYGRLLDLMLGVVSRKLSAGDLRSAMREVGRQVAADVSAKVTGKTRPHRVAAAVRILAELGGAATLEEENGTTFIRGRGCPIATVTAHHPEACLIAESLLTEVIGTPVKERCQRGPNPSCCFEIR